MIWDIDIARSYTGARTRFDLSVRFASDAERVVLVGPSGSGKSQTLTLIAGLSRPDRGHVAIAGARLFDAQARVDIPTATRGLGFVFQDYALFPHLSVRQNIAFGTHAGWRNPSRDVVHADVDAWIDRFELRAVEHLHPTQVSGGQRQRAALARALVTAPRALLLDEPFASLDRPLRQRLRDELLALQAQLRIPMLLITHDDEDVAAFAQHVVRLRDGTVVAD